MNHLNKIQFCLPTLAKRFTLLALYACVMKSSTAVSIDLTIRRICGKICTKLRETEIGQPSRIQIGFVMLLNLQKPN